jgi:hypothetical protein
MACRRFSAVWGRRCISGRRSESGRSCRRGGP